MCPSERHGVRVCVPGRVEIPGGVRRSWSICGKDLTGYVSSPSGKINLDDITGIYVRYVQYRDGRKREGISDHEEELIKAEHQVCLMHLFDAMRAVVVNRVRASVSNDSKLYQQLQLPSFGFLTPRTLVTTDPEQAVAFFHSCRRRIAKFIVIERRPAPRFAHLESKDLPRLELVRNCPTQFQEVVEGVDIRVHVVEEVIFATELKSEASDYRYASSTGDSLTARAIDIPPDVSAACVRLTRSSGLTLSGIDLRKTADDKYYCFEMNPSPGFIFYERATGQPISEAVAKLLLGGPH